MCNPKQWSLASFAGPDFTPDSLPASHGALGPFRLCSRSRPQPSPWALISKAGTSAPNLHPSQRVSRQTFQAGECWLALVLCVGISLLCSLYLCYCTLLHSSEASPLPTPSLHQLRGFLVCGNISSFTAPSQRCRSCLYTFVSYFPFSFFFTQFRGDFLAFWEV